MPENSDNVNCPAHYNQGGIECIDAIKASLTQEGFQAYLKASSMKYLWRYEHKGKPVEDLRKAEWFLVRLIGELESGISE
jgi:hypothetical protein